MLQTLQEEGYITARVDAAHRGPFAGAPADEQEERFTFWFLTGSGTGRRWYQV